MNKHDIARITRKLIIVFFFLLILYLYLPIANRIYISLLNIEILNYPGNNDLFFGTRESLTSPEDTLECIWGILAFFFSFVIPSGVIFLLGWRMLKRVDINRKRIYQSINDKRESDIESLMDDKEFNSSSNNTSLSVRKWLKIGKVFYASGNYQEAINSFSNAIDLSPNCKAYFNRGIVYNKLGNFKQTKSDLKTAARLGHKKSQKILSAKGIAW